MKNMKRILVTLVAAVLLMAVTVAGTLAYLMDVTGEVKNTFAVGNVQFKDNIGNGLNEQKVDVYGVDNGEGRTTENVYKLLPGHTYMKDPTVYIKDGSEPCFVFININKTAISYTKDGQEVVIEAAADPKGYQTIVQQMQANGWVNLSGSVWYYKNIVDTLNDATVEDFVIFNEFRLADDAVLPTTDAEIGSMKINITAYAVQADGFQTPILSEKDADGKYAPTAATADGAAAAWAATYGKN